MLVLVTGASTGLGLGAARTLAADGHDVVVHARSRGPKQVYTPPWHGLIDGDLSDLGQLCRVAYQANEFGRFDAVIHNAGVLDPAGALMVNVVAPYVLTSLMYRPGRLIYLSSSMHRSGSVDLRRFDRGAVTYSDSKLYVTALSAAAAHRWAGTVSHAVDPGWVPTRMGGPGAPDDLAAGYDTQSWLATRAVVPATGSYWHHRAVEQPHPATQDGGFQRNLLDRLHASTGVAFPTGDGVAEPTVGVDWG